MEQSVFVEMKFWLLVLFSLVVPLAIVWMGVTMRAVSRSHLLAFGLILVAIAGFDIYLLQALARMSRLTPSLADDAVFDSELTVGLYVLPALLAGVGVNVTSHVLIEHMTDAQRRLVRGTQRQPRRQALVDGAPSAAKRPDAAVQ